MQSLKKTEALNSAIINYQNLFFNSEKCVCAKKKKKKTNYFLLFFYVKFALHHKT